MAVEEMAPAILTPIGLETSNFVAPFCFVFKNGMVGTRGILAITMNKQPTSLKMHNTGIVVESLDTVIPFFLELGMSLEGRMMISGEWSGRVTGIRSQEVEIAMLVTPDGHSRIELSQFISPEIASDHRRAPVNSLGYLRVMFSVQNLEELLTRLKALGAEVVDEVVQYEDLYRLCYVRGPEGILIGLAEEIGQSGS